MNHIHYLSSGRSSSIEELLQSNLASIRLRMCPSIRAMLARNWRASTGDLIVDEPKKIVVTKIGMNDVQQRSNDWLEQIGKHKARGAQIYLDYTDHHLGFESPMTDFYRKVILLVDKAIVPSRSMQNTLSRFYKKPIDIVEDPIEISPQAVKPINMPVTLLWFGHASNIEYLIQFLRVGFGPEDSFRLIILTNESGISIFSHASIESHARIECQTGLWSPRLMLHAASISDACIIPSNVKDPRKASASSNRLITAFALGLPVAADTLDSYAEFSDYYVDIRSAQFKKFIQNPAAFHAQIDLAQKKIIPRFAIEQSELAWARALL